MMHRKELWAVLIVVVGVTAFLLYTAAHAIGQILSFQNMNLAMTNQLSDVDTSKWQTYSNPTFGFSLQYPSNWQISTSGLSGTDTFVALGNPLSGTSTYVMDIVIENNSSSLSSGEFVHQLLAADKAEDAANAKNGPTPAVTPQFERSYFMNIAGVEAYELFDVFEFDHDAEQIYVAHGNEMLRFDFPVADTNSNLSSPANNNAVAHLILDTLSF